MVPGNRNHAGHTTRLTDLNYESQKKNSSFFHRLMVNEKFTQVTFTFFTAYIYI